MIGSLLSLYFPNSNIITDGGDIYDAVKYISLILFQKRPEADFYVREINRTLKTNLKSIPIDDVTQMDILLSDKLNLKSYNLLRAIEDTPIKYPSV